MLGVSVSINRIDEHGGFGQNPIYRISPRLRTSPGQAVRRDKKFARIRSIADGGVDLCGDITTDTGKFWLPESDVLVHNCDRLVAWRVGELWAANIPARPVIKWQQLPKWFCVREMKFPPAMVPEKGISMVHVLVEWPDGTIEDPSKVLGMGGAFNNAV